MKGCSQLFWKVHGLSRQGNRQKYDESIIFHIITPPLFPGKASQTHGTWLVIVVAGQRSSRAQTKAMLYSPPPQFVGGGGCK